jgi:hypothetical protein
METVFRMTAPSRPPAPNESLQLTEARIAPRAVTAPALRLRS